MEKNVRQKVFKILYEINEKDAFSNMAINKNIKGIRDNDIGLVREIVYGVLENKIYIDFIIKKFSKIKLRKISPAIKNILEMGIYQIIFLDRIPDSAAVNESVKLSKKYGHKGTHGFVNGVLRNVVRNKNKIELPDKKNNPIQYLSVKYSHPEWMIKKWIKDYGYSFAEGICIANNKKPHLNIRVNTLKTSREELFHSLESKNLKVKYTKYAKEGLIIENPKNITRLKEFKDGLFQIQDESSMLVGQIMNPKDNSFIIDVCSAPGGKSTHLAEKMNNRGKIIARDIYNHKLELIEENIKRLGTNIITTEKFNGLELDKKLLEKVDYCLVDAPCSGLGLIRRKPDIKWTKKENNLEELIKLQYQILNNGSKYVKKGGTLIYSTCTTNKEENIKIIKKFLAENKDFTLKGFDDLVKDIEGAEKGFIELYPNIHNVDGFFIAKLIKK
ncbi:16S rRNA (cytosine(967)-C(5))-methyltransferase RsmB [Dethiothermospora halolimnae]|uniref:16S rRNA (cytosine(967)-C(5))-methyltransferase RsmB n=1 Tax=Dethiothermospora halolimnae TaxID=3114390 RepID=UPI003CCC3080